MNEQLLNTKVHVFKFSERNTKSRIQMKMLTKSDTSRADLRINRWRTE